MIFVINDSSNEYVNASCTHINVDIINVLISYYVFHTRRELIRNYVILNHSRRPLPASSIPSTASIPTLSCTKWKDSCSGRGRAPVGRQLALP